MPMPHHSRSAISLRRGFSLIEIVVVMLIIGILIGSSLYYVSGKDEEKILRSEHGKIEDLIRQGRSLSISYQQTFVLELSEGQASLAPMIIPGEDVETNTSLEEGGNPSRLQPLEEMTWPRIEEVDLTYAMEVRRWGQQDFMDLEEKRVERILIEPSGLFEPLSILLTRDEGANSLSRVFHPLTALAEDETLTITGKE